MKPLIGTDLKRFHKQYKRANRPDVRIAALLQSIEYPANVGSIFRMADGAGIEELYLSGITPQPPHPTIDKVGRNKSRRVPWRYINDPVEAAGQAKTDGYHLVAVEIATDAIPYHEFDYPQDVCLVVGHEDHGVTKAMLAECEAAVFLPMYGKGQSLNVHVALSIVTYHILHTSQSAK